MTEYLNVLKCRTDNVWLKNSCCLSYEHVIFNHLAE